MSAGTHRSLSTWGIPVAIYLVASAVYVFLGSLQVVPLVAPDEFLYGQLARSVAAGDGIALYGVGQDWPMALYIYLLAPSWLLASGESAYELAKVTGALAVCSVVFPTWALARRLMPMRPAVVPVVLAVSGTWMVTAAGLLTENLALPLSTGALIAAVLALREDGSRWQWAAFGFAAAATTSRAQMAVLFPILLCALLLDVACSSDRRARIQHHRLHIAILGTITLVGLAVFFGGSQRALGPYTEVADFRPPLGRLLTVIGEQWIALAVASAFLPMAALLALSAQRPAWRDRDLGPLLCVTVPAALLFVGESAYFNAGLGDRLEWSIERYVQYAIPLMLVLLFVAVNQQRLRASRLLIAGAVVALPLLATPKITVALEERAQFATWTYLDQALGLATGPAVSIVAAAVIGLGTLLVTRARADRSVFAVGTLLLAVFVLQSQAIWKWYVDYTTLFRTQYPAQLSWVNDNAGGGPVSRLYLLQNSPLFQTADFFNDRTDKVLVPAADVSERAPAGRVCFWTADGRGVLRVSPGCPLRQRLWNDDPFATLSFYGGRTIARDARLGQILAVPPEPRLRSIVRAPCPRTVLLAGLDGSSPRVPRSVRCAPDMSVSLWVDSPGSLEVTFEGGARVQRVRQGARSWTLPPRKRTTLRVPVNSAAISFLFNTDWRRSAGAPRLVDAAFVTKARREPLL